MTLRILSASVLAAAALSVVPATPASAVGVLPCPPGEIGVIVVDANGELAHACVRRDEIDAAVDAAVDALEPFRNCPPSLLLPSRIYTQGEFIVIEGGPDEYFRCVNG